MLKEYLHTGVIDADIKAGSRSETLEELANLLANDHKELQPARIASALSEREKIDSTGIEEGIAIPHAKVPGIKGLAVAVGRSVKGVNFGAHDKKPTRLFFVIIAPEGGSGEHIKVLARIAKLLSMKGLKEKLLSAKDAGQMYEILIGADDKLGS
jgi:PTS system nitrogen regulatory IIA component